MNVFRDIIDRFDVEDEDARNILRTMEYYFEYDLSEMSIEEYDRLLKNAFIKYLNDPHLAEAL